MIMKEPNRIYFYKMTSDSGGAPCVHGKILSLAICKPDIRRTARVDDLIFGFGGEDLGGRLIYAAFVTEKCYKDYYVKRKYKTRPDCIYHKMNGKAAIKKNARYHSTGDQLEKDIGKNFKKAYVLLSSDFRYFGSKGNTNYRKQCKALKKALHRLTQGHRVNHGRKLRDELLLLAERLWRYPQKKNVKPSHYDSSQHCNTDSGTGRC